MIFLIFNFQFSGNLLLFILVGHLL